MGKSKTTPVTLRKRQQTGTGFPSHLPGPFKENEILCDISKKRWKIGKSVGVGGFGEIYLATDEIHSPVINDAKYAIKIEPHSSGPLFVEINCYLRIAKEEMIKTWKKEKGLRFLGMSHYIASGSHMYRGDKYRFLVLPRFGNDLGKLFIKKKKKFHLKTVLTLAIQILDILEYIHSKGYIHADIKGSNLCLGNGPNGENEVYLLDYGLACRYMDSNGTHKEYNLDQRKAHDGTLEHTSRDAHVGAHSRRGDLEILGYNMIQWLCGYLPWEDLTDPEEVAKEKNNAMADVTFFLKQCFADSDPPVVLQHFLKYVLSLNFDTKPDYDYCKMLFRHGIRQAGFADDNKLNFNTVPAKLKSKKRVRSNGDSDIENIIELKPVKVPRCSNRLPCVVVQQNNVTDRLTRSAKTANTSVVLRSHEQFDWVKVLQSNPDKINAVHNTAKKLKTRPKTPGPEEMVLKKEEVNVRVNPTPAIIQILNKKSKVGVKRNVKSESRCETPVIHEERILTAAMEEVLRRRALQTSTFRPICVPKLTRCYKKKTDTIIKPIPTRLPLQEKISSPVTRSCKQESKRVVTRSCKQTKTTPLSSRRSVRNKPMKTFAKNKTSPFVFKPRARREVSPSEIDFVPRLRSGRSITSSKHATRQNKSCFTTLRRRKSESEFCC